MGPRLGSIPSKLIMFFYKLSTFLTLKKNTTLFKLLNLQRFDYNFFLRTQTSELFSIFFYNLNSLKQKKILVYSLKSFSLDFFFKKYFFVLIFLTFFFFI